MSPDPSSASRSDSSSEFDLIVLGSGSGNSVLTEDMAGWKIAVIEESTFGGTCLNVGCIPTKMFVYAADVAHSVDTSSRYGIDAHIDDVRWLSIRDRIFGRIDPISAGGRQYRLGQADVTLFEQHAEFVGARRLRLADGHEITGKQVVVATGARAVIPDVVTDSGVPFETSDTVMRLPRLPKHLIILGGGYIAAEFAHVFSSLGTKVSIVARSATLLRAQDETISHAFTALAEQAWDVHLNASVKALSTHDGDVVMRLEDGTTVSGDVLLVATGRVPNGDRIGATEGGIELDDDGRVVVDEFQRTSADGVWALGDVSSPQQLKHVANQDARVVAHNLTHPDQLKPSRHDAIPSAVFTQPQIATVGLTEQDAREAGVNFVTYVQHFGDTAYGWAMEDTTGICKLLADPSSGLLVGAHLMGPQASVLIQPLIQALVFKQRLRDVAENQYWIHPALSEVVENAILGLEFD